MPIVAFVVHGLQCVELGVDPVEGVTHGKVNSEALWVADVGGDDGLSFCSVHPSGFNLGFVSGVCPEHQTVFWVQGKRGRIVQLAFENNVNFFK